MEPNYKNLLDQVSAIAKRYEKINELTGENFNVFKILKLESSEVRMHSAFIAELLNPKGSHGQKEVFLELFVKMFCFKGNSIDIKNCNVHVEKHIGLINDDGTEGGRIDIFIDDRKGNHIIIENKINAGDQQNQLMRYYTHSPNADIIYLTLEGKDAGDFSKGELIEDEHYKRFSYKIEILEWLEKCRKEVAVYPVIREALTHYINLIKHLTNQTINNSMEEEVSTLLKDNLEASWVIANNLDAACQKVSEEFGLKITKAFQNLNLYCKYEIDFKQRYSGLYIWKPDWTYFSIGFSFQRYDKELIYGFVQDDPDKFILPQNLKTAFKQLPNNTLKVNSWWPWYRMLEDPYNNWNELEAWQAILDGRMENIMIEK